MKAFILFLSMASTLALTAGETLTEEQFLELAQWHNRLPASGKAGQAFIGCSYNSHSGIDRYQQRFDECVQGYDRTRSCAYRCNGPTMVYGYYLALSKEHEPIKHVIYCECLNIIHDDLRYPVPGFIERSTPNDFVRTELMR